MAYKAFIAATSRDLKPQREYVARQLRDAGLIIDPMENWPADSENPATLSAQRLAGCQFCIALIGFQRGTIAINDAGLRSITQIEIDEAKRLRLQLLVFLLRDTPHNHAAIADELDQLDDPAVVEWRRSFERDVTCAYFDIGDGVDQMPDVLPSITRQMTTWEKIKRRRWRKIALILLAVAILSGILFYTMTGLQSFVISRSLALHDPVAFNHSRSGNYYVARLLDGRADLRANTNFRKELLSTKKSFSILANGFTSFREFEKEFASMASRGVRIRIIMTNFSEENRHNWASFASAVGLSNPDADAAVGANIYEFVYSLHQQFPDNIELRLNSQPILYTMWVRDVELPNALAHVGIHYYGGQKDWPYFRITRTTGGGQIESLHQQFKLVWDEATSYQPAPPVELR